jgi:hypothetical protein
LTYKGSRCEEFILHRVNIEPNEQRNEQEQLPIVEAEAVVEPSFAPHYKILSDPSTIVSHQAAAMPPAYAPHYDAQSDP